MEMSIFSLTMLCDMWDLSSPTRGLTYCLCSGSAESTSGPPGKSQNTHSFYYRIQKLVIHSVRARSCFGRQYSFKLGISQKKSDFSFLLKTRMIWKHWALSPPQQLLANGRLLGHYLICQAPPSPFPLHPASFSQGHYTYCRGSRQ